MYIYKTTNLVNGKIYIGQSVNPDNGMYLGSGVALKRAVRLYGRDNFKREILEENIPNVDELNKLEIHYIKLFESTNRNIGYNIESGGNGDGIAKRDYRKNNCDYVKTDEYRNHMSEIMKNVKHNGQWQTGDTPWNAGKKDVYSDETIEKMRRSAINKNISEETEMERRAKISEYQQENNPIRKGVLDVETGVEYKSIAEYCEKTNTSWYKTKRYRKEGKIEVYENKND